MIKIVLPYLLPSNNHLIRMSWHKRLALSKKYNKDIREYCLSNGIELNKPIMHCNLYLHSYTYRFKDYDNMTGGSKILIDCIKPPIEYTNPRGAIKVKHKDGLGLIYDDDDEHLAMHFMQFKIKSRDCLTELILMDIDTKLDYETFLPHMPYERLSETGVYVKTGREDFLPKVKGEI